MNGSVLWQLLRVFAPLSLLTIGGGQSIIADIQQQTVSSHQWLSQEQFLDDFAISKASPGPNIMMVPLIGWQVAGLAGAVVAALGIFLPSTLLFYLVAHAWRMQAFDRWRDRLARGLAPVSVGLVLAGTWSIMVTNGGGWLGWLVMGGALLVLSFTRVHPLLLLGSGGAIFLLAH